MDSTNALGVIVPSIRDWKPGIMALGFRSHENEPDVAFSGSRQPGFLAGTGNAVAGSVQLGEGMGNSPDDGRFTAGFRRRSDGGGNSGSGETDFPGFGL